MRNLFYSVCFALLLFTVSSCAKEKIRGCTSPTALNYKSTAEEDDGSCQYTGYVTFWNDDNAVGVITVNMDAATATITQSVHPIDCSSAGVANFEDLPGTYSFTASATTGETWSGTVTITSKGCLKMHLN